MTLFAPAERREDLFALYALNLEIAKTREIVTEPLLGQIRLQWWREALAELFTGTVRRHSVIEALAAASARTRLSRSDLDRLIDAREGDLGAAPASMAALEAYGEATSSTLLWLAADLYACDDHKIRDALGHIGVAWALTGLIRAIPFHARARRRFIPDDVAGETGLRESDLFELCATESLRRAVGIVAAAARGRLERARDTGAAPSRDLQALFLPAVLARAYLGRAERQGYDVMARTIDLPRLFKIVLLARAVFRRRL
jgi:phytoene synthase